MHVINQENGVYIFISVNEKLYMSSMFLRTCMRFMFLIIHSFVLYAFPQCYLEKKIFLCLFLLTFSLGVPGCLLRNNSLASQITMNFLNTKNKELNQDDIILLIVNFHSGSHLNPAGVSSRIVSP